MGAHLGLKFKQLRLKEKENFWLPSPINCVLHTISLGLSLSAVNMLDLPRTPAVTTPPPGGGFGVHQTLAFGVLAVRFLSYFTED